MQISKRTKVLKIALWVLLCAAVYALGTAGLSWGLTWLYQSAMSMWGVTPGNFSYAPGWIHAIAYGFGAFSALLEAVWVAFTGKWLLKLNSNKIQKEALEGFSPPRSPCQKNITPLESQPQPAGGMNQNPSFLIENSVKARRFGPFAPLKGPLFPGFLALAAGVGMAILCALVLLLVDGVRMGHPLTMPRFTSSTMPYFLSLLFSAAAGEWFFRGVLQGGLGDSWLATEMISTLYALFFGLNGLVSGLNLINLWLFSVLLCRVYARKRSLWACLGLRAGYAWMAQAVLGMGGAPGLYELYFTSRAYLSGGAAGPMAGLSMTAILLAATAIWERKALGPAARRLLHSAHRK